MGQRRSWSLSSSSEPEPGAGGTAACSSQDVLGQRAHFTAGALVSQFPSVVIRVPLPTRDKYLLRSPKLGERKLPNPPRTRVLSSGGREFLMSLLLVPAGEGLASPRYLGSHLKAPWGLQRALGQEFSKLLKTGH